MVMRPFCILVFLLDYTALLATKIQVTFPYTTYLMEPFKRPLTELPAFTLPTLYTYDGKRSVVTGYLAVGKADFVGTTCITIPAHVNETDKRRINKDTVIGGLIQT
ncbi:unnamed protein product [Euphydryas editha]|uniref:Uncharacterized protein n=1 Tax=Euphydryas editha TaxID=104508 RepID=A0AAU9TZ16_EUPED|nr:unnamed protein product [Euphydryas editha]